jgi:hypothetical protein
MSLDGAPARPERGAALQKKICQTGTGTQIIRVNHWELRPCVS